MKTKEYRNLKIAQLNINGITDRVKMESLKQLLFDEHIDVLFVLEVHPTQEKIRLLRDIFSDFDMYEKFRKEKNQKKYAARGGIICLVRAGISKLGKRTKCDDLLWIKVGDLNLAGAYFVPAHSSFAKKNDRRMLELQDEVIRLSLLKEHVLVLTDANGWIGESPSTIEDGEEERTVFARTSEKPKPNPQGRWFSMNMNSKTV